ncbi:hypothetical protein [Kineococcus sp. SYSU DK003]|uniref:hypothetical protein n=1 Tax=Kineococcus sp. SYSU DK003 TaxID=3383124 RepID=UPI003D7CC664
MTPTKAANSKGTYEIRIGLWASQEQTFKIRERLSRALGPEPEYDGPCEVSWFVAVMPPEAVDQGEDRYDELVQQAKIEGTY